MRFTDNNNGTVTDTLTGLIWLKDANQFGRQNWQSALDTVSKLASGTYGLHDGSIDGSWRLPSVSELISLIDYSSSNPALPLDHPYTNVQSCYYWSSATGAGADNTGYAWYVNLDDGHIYSYNGSGSSYIWPVQCSTGEIL